ncbi:alpha/beta fold hydrolase [Gordonia neofelifaecis]|uniref:Putative hydrolase n=1 Tax=Gordonia neofelifaecis NRRL B-59395 TaxID=644548 RepID=F1YGC7_9ACTN|nr:alpha/beta fold hydrolase [Gordonia neofelifaecis]EGD56074.1 putative hydrolase [Gordonia neofelifaecis NRRL B-59395]
MLSDLRTLARVLTDGLAPTTASESVVLSERPHAKLVRYGSAEQLQAARDSRQVPVLLVPPLAVPAHCYDLAPDAQPGNSVVEFLLSTGTIPYVVDFGDVSYADRRLGFEDYFDTFVPRAVAEVIDDFRSAPDAVDLMGWSLGGTLSLMTAGAHRDLPIRSVITVGTPLDYKKVEPYPLVRTLLSPTQGRPVTYLLRAMGGIPSIAVQIAYRATAWDRELRKPKYILDNLKDTEALIRMQVIDRFQNSMPGYPGKVSEQMLVNLVLRDEIARGTLHFDGIDVDLTAITAPIFMVGSHRDAIVSHAAAEHGLDLFTESVHTEFHTVETSHLGLLTGAVAEEQTWPAIAAFRDKIGA